MEQLTERETEVLRLLGEGLGDQQIAALLHIEPGTVRTHVAHIKLKLVAATRIDLALRARDLGLL